jgi:hypothetical protein
MFALDVSQINWRTTGRFQAVCAKELGELFRWCQVSERLAWPAIEARSDAGQAGGGVQ